MGICFLITSCVWTGALLADKAQLRRELIRLHIVGASDSQEDQTIKLRVRDAIVASLEEGMADVLDAEQAKAYLQENLPKIEEVANRVLEEYGSSDFAVAPLGMEEFAKRVYDTFTLPAGVYQALRITIGEGEGRNWWCVAFPSLCMPTTTEEFTDAASCAGLDEDVVAALAGEADYEVRFFLLECIGRLENFLYRG